MTMSIRDQSITRLRQAAFTTVAVALLMITAPAPAVAQETRPADPTRVISINPFILLFGWFSGEYEQRITPTLAVAVAGSHVELFDDDVGYTNLDAKVRLYPNERALQGFGLGVSLGFTQLRAREYQYDDSCRFEPFECQEPIERFETYSSPSLGVEITYQWLLGTRKATAITVGGGAKRFISSKADIGNNQLIIPTGRISVGYAF
jgi:hypothetical protein